MSPSDHKISFVKKEVFLSGKLKKRPLEDSELLGTRCPLLILSAVSIFSVTIGCAGPFTPFGALNTWSVPSKVSSEGEPTSSKTPVQIRFLPKRQVLHDKSDMVVEIHDKEAIPSLSNIKVFYNSIDVTDSFLSNVEVKNRIKEKILEVEFKNVRLKLLGDNQIKLGYQKNKTLYTSQFLSPTCDYFDTKPVNNIQGFRPPNDYLLWVSEISKKHKFNPNFLTGIVAQESGFNPNAISWAKAIGLTQMTQLAEEQIRVEDKKWPQSREISSLNYIQLKQKVSEGEINRDNEWRLHPQLSLQGGAEYIRYLYGYWQLEENKQWLDKLPGDANTNLSQVILASYNSGPSRVKAAILTDNENWIKKEELREAYKYINRVFSYCYHFSERSVSDDG